MIIQRKHCLKRTILFFIIVFFLTQIHISPLFASTDRENIHAMISVNQNVDLPIIEEQIEKVAPEAKLRQTFDRSFYGLSYEVPLSLFTVIKNIPGVERIDKVSYYESSLKDSVPFIGAEAIRSQLDEKGLRLTGRGVKVGIIDTGIDYNHPDLRSNYKKGYDVVDEDGDPMETQGPKGMATIHGTHVAGIIAANGSVRGVAPKADLYVYRALGPAGQGSTEQIIAAIEKAMEDEVDVLNLSLGTPVNGQDWPTSLALDKAAEAGIVTVTSNGNSGPDMWTVGSPGTSEKAISVGASIPPLKTPRLTLYEDKKAKINPQSIQGTKPWTFKRDLPLVYGGLGMPEDVKDSRGKAVLIERGGIAVSKKVENAKEAGAEAVILYNNVAGSLMAGIREPVDIPAVTVSREDGEFLLQCVKEHEEDESDPTPAVLRTVYEEETDHMAMFSSRGPVTNSWTIKPDVVAPGVDIDSTVPNGYLPLNGTSMAAPHVAGAAALLLQAHPDWGVEQVKAALMNGAEPLKNEHDNRYPSFVQGAGRVNMAKALTLDTLVYPGTLSFGVHDPNDPIQTREITIENISNKKQVYSFNAPSGLKMGFRWHFPLPVILEPGEKKTVEIKLEIQPDLIEFDQIDGEVVIEGGRHPIHLPFLHFMNEPNYPRIGAFQLEPGDNNQGLKYELYVPGGAEEIEIALYDPDTSAFVGTLDHVKSIEPGIYERILSQDHWEGKTGIYRAVIYVKEGEREDMLETMIELDEEKAKIPGSPLQSP